jgi:large subunit ribosomal protein L20
MPRSVNSVASRARRKKILKRTRGYWGKRKNVWTIAKNVYEKGLTYAYRGRKDKKIVYRGIWIQRINAAVRVHGMSYSQFIAKATEKNLGLNRKVLADLALNHPEAFNAVIEAVK